MFLYGKGDEIHKLGTGLLYNTEHYQQLREERLFVRGCHIYIALRVCWCNAVLNVHAQREDVNDDSREFL